MIGESVSPPLLNASRSRPQASGDATSTCNRRSHNSTMSRTPPLVGRSAEMAELERQYRRALGGEFRCVLLLADAGIGKTRLAREFMRHRRGAVTALPARAYALGETAAFGVWSEALEGHLRMLAPSEVAELCGGFLDDLAALIRRVGAAPGSGPGEEARGG